MCLHESPDFTAWIDTTFVFRDGQRGCSVETLNDEDTVEPRPRRHDVDKLVQHICVRGSRGLVGAHRGVAVIYSSNACIGACAEAGGLAEIVPTDGLVLPPGRAQSNKLVEPWLRGFLSPEV